MRSFAWHDIFIRHSHIFTIPCRFSKKRRNLSYHSPTRLEIWERWKEMTSSSSSALSAAPLRTTRRRYGVRAGAEVGRVELMCICGEERGLQG